MQITLCWSLAILKVFYTVLAEVNMKRVICSSCKLFPLLSFDKWQSFLFSCSNLHMFVHPQIKSLDCNRISHQTGYTCVPGVIRLGIQPTWTTKRLPILIRFLISFRAFSDTRAVQSWTSLTDITHYVRQNQAQNESSLFPLCCTHIKWRLLKVFTLLSPL